ncbi:General transcription factor 3C polypeptide 5, partial [Cucurbita argyrosperma subsp. sororia]
MGKLKDNTISGFLPTAQVFAVHYPGYPSSKRRAVETLGGKQSILKVRDLQSNKLELRFRPEDPYSHPTHGELRPCSCFLLKICHPKSESTEGIKKVEKEVPREDEINLDFEMVACVPEAYHFEGMADYQHVVATHADATKRKKGSWTEMHEPCLGKVNAIDVDKEDTMILVPPLFALKDVPESLVLKTPSMFTPRKKQETPHTPCEVDIEPVLAIDFNIKDILTVIWEKYVPQGSEEWDYQVAVSNLFEERPIWPKESLVERMLKMGLVFRHGVFRRLLSRIAYYFSSGPFQRFWIKKGYDPRKDCDSRKVCGCLVRLVECTQVGIETLGYWKKYCLEHSNAEPLLRAASENFEKLKRDIKKGCLKVDQGGDHQANAAVINDDKLEANSGEEDEDGLAVESGDEALDEYDEFNMVGDDDEISLQSHSYLNMDDVSRTHLQELFGSFPSMDEDDQKLDDGDGSEEEYQIYEQDSDIDSDDDDS